MFMVIDYLNVSFPGDRCASTSVSPIGKSGAFSFSRKHKKIPAALKEVGALDDIVK